MGAITKLLEGCEYEVLCGDVNGEYTEFVTDSRKICEGCAFVCIKGANFDGHSAAAEAVKKGAALIVVERGIDEIEGLAEAIAAAGAKNDLETVEASDATDRNACTAAGGGAAAIVKVASTRAAMAYMAAAYHDWPARKLNVIGITGTKGKTTTTYLIRSILSEAGRKVGLIGTIEVIIGDEHIKANNTTPESTLLQEYLHRMVDAGCDTVVMEVSSQGLMLHRTLGIDFTVGIFTNIEPDHIAPGEHESFEHYIQCKSLLFRQCETGIVNGDADHLDDVLKGHTCKVVTYGIDGDYDYTASNMSLFRDGAKLGAMFDVTGKLECAAKVMMPGRFSVYNALSAIAVCDTLGISSEAITAALPKGFVKGRIEPVHVSDDFTLLIDYAHNAMALESLLVTLREYEPGRIVCLFGCGGNRARDRRFEMGEVSGRLADYTIITSDNPRREEPLDIMKDIETGIKKTSGEYIMIENRKEAIAYAIHNGRPGDVIVLAGKGHEDYQEINGVKYPMDERDLIAEIMEEATTKA